MLCHIRTQYKILENNKTHLQRGDLLAGVGGWWWGTPPCQMSICVRKISNAFLRKEKESVSNVFEVIPKSENDH